MKVQDLRYGENPHQSAALYREPGPPAGVAGATQLGGKELSFNNLLDLEAAWAAARDFAGRPFAVIVKHNNPCGAGVGSDPAQAFELALAGDPVSAFGGVIGVSRLVTPALARQDHRDLLRGGHRPRLRAQSPRDPALEEGPAHPPGGPRRRPRTTSSASRAGT